jgi:hypothetical protein
MATYKNDPELQPRLGNLANAESRKKEDRPRNKRNGRFEQALALK